MKNPNQKVLVVEDDPIFAKLLVVQLRTMGHRVVVAVDGVQAISLARKESPDLILLDLGLPGGGGLLVLKRLRQLACTAFTPIIVISGRDPEVHSGETVAYGANAFLHKPFPMGALETSMVELG